MIVIANTGDSRAVMATTSDDGNSVPLPIQLTVDFKPNLPRSFLSLYINEYIKWRVQSSYIFILVIVLLSEEAERIAQCNGRVFCLPDEPGTPRIWLPNRAAPGLSMSRSFGDFCVKHFGLISMPDVTQRTVTSKDLFVVLATDGVSLSHLFFCSK